MPEEARPEAEPAPALAPVAGGAPLPAGPETSPGETWAAAVALGVPALGVGYAIQLANGNLHEVAIRWVLASLVLVTFAVVRVRGVPFLERWADRPAVFVLGAGLVYQLTVHLTTLPGIYLRQGSNFAWHHTLVAVGAVLCGALLSSRPWLGRLAVPLLLAVHLLLGVWMIQSSPSPFIDVFHWHNEAFRKLLSGHNPFVGPMPNIYGHTLWYAPGIADATQVQSGYPYPPLGLLMALPGHLLGGDYRYANLVAITLAGAAMATMRGGRLGAAAGAVFLFTPRGFFILEQGFTDAHVVLLLSLTVFLACRRPALVPYAFGLLMAVKQYTVFFGPLFLLLLPRPWTVRAAARFLGRAAAVAAVVTAPLALWSFSAYYESAYARGPQNPFRPEALTILAWTARDGVPILPRWLGFVAVMAGLAVSLWRAPRTPFGFAAASTLVFLLFSAFNWYAFSNQYFVVTAGLCTALGALAPTSGRTP